MACRRSTNQTGRPGCCSARQPSGSGIPIWLAAGAEHGAGCGPGRQARCRTRAPGRARFRHAAHSRPGAAPARRPPPRPHRPRGPGAAAPVPGPDGFQQVHRRLLVVHGRVHRVPQPLLDLTHRPAPSVGAAATGPLSCRSRVRPREAWLFTVPTLHPRASATVGLRQVAVVPQDEHGPLPRRQPGQRPSRSRGPRRRARVIAGTARAAAAGQRVSGRRPTAATGRSRRWPGSAARTARDPAGWQILPQCR